MNNFPALCPGFFPNSSVMTPVLYDHLLQCDTIRSNSISGKDLTKSPWFSIAQNLTGLKKERLNHFEIKRDTDKVF